MNKEEMKQYTGTKTVKAEPMNELVAEEKDYAHKNEDNHEWREGYHVQYTNTDGNIYDSWFPKLAFENAYKPSETFLDRLILEYAELIERKDKYNGFLKSEKFKEIDKLSQALLSVQNGIIDQYSCVLEDRFTIANNKKPELNLFTFGTAVLFLRAGMAVRRAGWNGKELFVVKQVPSHITADIIPNMQSLPQSAKDIIMSRKEPHIDYTNQMLIIHPDGRADSWVPSSSDVFAEDWELVIV